MISGSVSLLCSRFFSPFPHGTGSLSVSRSYLALRDGPRGFGQDFSCPGLLRCRLCLLSVFAYGAITRYGSSFQRLRLTSVHPFVDGPTTPVGAETPPVWALARSLATTGAIIGLFSLPPGTEMFQFPGFASPTGGYRPEAGGLPHSEICGSRDICSSPQLIAAYHVLLRLREPRHPSCALVSFLYDLCFFNRFEHHSARSLKSSLFCCDSIRNRGSFLVFRLI